MFSMKSIYNFKRLVLFVIFSLFLFKSTYSCDPQTPAINNVYINNNYIGSTGYYDSGTSIPTLFKQNLIFNKRSLNINAQFYEACDSKLDGATVWICNVDENSCSWNNKYTGWVRKVNLGGSCNRLNSFTQNINLDCNNAGYCHYRLKFTAYDWCNDNGYNSYSDELFEYNGWGQAAMVKLDFYIKGEPTYTMIIPDVRDTLLNTNTFIVRILDNNLDNSHRNDNYYTCYYRIVQSTSQGSLGNYDSGWIKRNCGFNNQLIILNINCPYEGTCTIRSFVNSPTEQWYDIRKFYIRKTDRFVSFLRFNGFDYSVIGSIFSSNKDFNCKNGLSIDRNSQSSFCGSYLDNISIITQKFNNPTKDGYRLYANGPTADKFCKEKGYDYVKDADVSTWKANNLRQYKNGWVRVNNFFFFTSITCMKIVGKKVKAKCLDNNNNIGYGTYSVQKFPNNYGTLRVEIEGSNLSLLKDSIEPVLINRLDYKKISYNNWFDLEITNNASNINKGLIELDLKDVIDKYGYTFVIEDMNGNKINFCFEGSDGKCIN